jgi:hypothetical protein
MGETPLIDNRDALATLDMCGDGDEVYLVEYVEQVFDIKFADAEMEATMTVGDLFARILERFPEPAERRRVCLSACAFYALRRSLSATHPRYPLTLQTSLSPFANRESVRALWARLESDAGLCMPRLRIGWTPVGPLLSALRKLPRWAGFALGVIAMPIAVALAVPSFFATALFVRQLPAYVDTLGDLAREVSVINFGRLSRRYNSYRVIDLWEALVSAIRFELGTEGVIGPKTTFMRVTRA